MSIYGSTFELDGEIWDEEDGHLGAPYIYVGSHRTGNPELRGGSFDFAEVVPWCSADPYLRVSISEALSRFVDADVLIDLDQTRALRDYLTNFIERVESGEWHEWGAIELEDIADEPIADYLRRYEATPSDLERLRKRRGAA